MANKEMEVVRGLDVKRYMGRWYEIASFPSRFQPKDGVDTRATYTLKEDGTVHVLNETWSGGKRSYIEGTAYKADPKSDEAKLKVKFYVPPFLPIIPIVGDYWVLYIDDEYQYALIGQPSRNYLWILSRRSHLDEEIFNQLVQRAKDEGYDVSKLHKTPQNDTPPEEQGPVDTKATMAANIEMEVVKGLDLKRYMGRWYEIASIPSEFQPKDGVDTRATYTLNDDGTVHVLNEVWSGGKRKAIEGTAYKADPKSDEAKFKVKFYLPPFLPIFPVIGDYWVLYIDDQYQHAVIGEPRMKNLWILSRTSHIDDSVYNQLVQRAKDEGYDVSKLHKTPQSNTPPEKKAL